MTYFLSFITTIVGDDETNLTKIISLITFVAVIALFVILCFTTKKISVKTLTYMAVSISLSFVLSFIKVKLAVTGGSITLFSMVPLILFAYFFGPLYGLLAGFIYGLLQFISDPYILTYATFFLDYLLPYASIFLCGIFGTKMKNQTLSISLGVVLYLILRLTFHVLSGILFFNAGYVYDQYPQSSAFIYSLVYNLLYVGPDTILSLIFIIIFSSTKSFKKFGEILKK